jgi:hypothetical protein
MSLFEFEGIQLDPDRFVTEEAFEECLAEQSSIALYAMEHFMMLGQESGAKANVDYFYSTNTKEKADTLMAELANRGFRLSLSMPHPPEALFSIVATRLNVVITERNLILLAREMCKIGYIFDCSFDAWGMGFFTEVDGDFE